MLKSHSRLVENLALAGDLLLIAACWIGSYGIRFYLLPVTDVPPFRDYALQLVPILLVWGIAFRTFDLYRPNRLGSRRSEWWDVAKASTLGALVLVSIMTFVFRGYEYSRLVIILFLAQSIVVVSLARAGLREVLRFARRHGYNLRYAIVVGGGEPAAEVLRVLNRRRDVGIFVLGLLSDKKEVPDNVRWLGGIEDVRAVLDRQQVDIVVIALPHADAARLTTVLGGIGDDPIAIHLVPDVFGLVPARGGIEEFETIPFIHLRESRLYGWNRVVKRVFDLVFGALALAVAAPLMLAIAVALKLTSSGAVLYRQERMGVDGRRFRMLKFRTMQVNAEAATGPVWARADDPRRTPLGVFLRRTSLDELPQLFNVLRGEMSLVGPRPERPSFVEEFRRRVPGYMLRHKMKAGITGWAQINGWRGNTSIEKRIEHDLYYIERWSLAFDLKILLQTLWYGFRVNRNAH
ncbi:MAG: undecaprenyl-phosphate glucose phosphotransferase [Candidatus Rokuibacteriota bacterium]|nr:MAG: undecaprenyl-phosphate glucose phosphotransferase [Candidatus Rokubacteria bacterium]